jgi:hypothetical protein
VGILQPKCRRHSCLEIDLVCSVYVSAPRVRVFKGSTEKGFPCAILRRLIVLSMKGFMIARLIHIEVLSDALPLEGVPTWVKRVVQNMRLSTNCSSCMYDSSTMVLCV